MPGARHAALDALAEAALADPDLFQPLGTRRGDRRAAARDPRGRRVDGALHRAARAARARRVSRPATSACCAAPPRNGTRPSPAELLARRALAALARLRRPASLGGRRGARIRIRSLTSEYPWHRNRSGRRSFAGCTRTEASPARQLLGRRQRAADREPGRPRRRHDQRRRGLGARLSRRRRPAGGPADRHGRRHRARDQGAAHGRHGGRLSQDAGAVGDASPR